MSGDEVSILVTAGHGWEDRGVARGGLWGGRSGRRQQGSGSLPGKSH